ncbi:MAG TPA: copper-binding protein [Candidatus Binatia bacterium]|nr:copper-binding protein [Candidatus Binatia bacterium]
MEQKFNIKLVGGLFLFISLLVVAGCAAYKLEPLTANHPAHPETLAASEPPMSRTLAYTKADIPSAQSVQAASEDMKMDMTKEKHGAGAAGAKAPQTAVGEGSVIAVVPSSGQIVLEHGMIKDFMDAMTMGYKVESNSILEGLKQGDKVRFTIDIDKKAIVKIEKMK